MRRRRNAALAPDDGRMTYSSKKDINARRRYRNERRGDVGDHPAIERAVSVSGYFCRMIADDSTDSFGSSLLLSSHGFELQSLFRRRNANIERNLSCHFLVMSSSFEESVSYRLVQRRKIRARTPRSLSIGEIMIFSMQPEVLLSGKGSRSIIMDMRLAGSRSSDVRIRWCTWRRRTGRRPATLVDDDEADVAVVPR